MNGRIGSAIAGVLFALFAAAPARALWYRVFEEDFSADPATRWLYEGVSNATDQALFRYDALNQRIEGEWDQANLYSGAGDPQTIRNSRLTAPLARVLTDRDTFRFGATIRIAEGSIPDTTEFFQIANFGLYNISPDVWGDDRAQSDNFSGNTTIVRDANSFVEFNYFINNRSFGFNPFVQGTLVAEMPPDVLDNTPYFVTGTGSDPLFNDTDMGADTYLPTGTNLYVEVVYHGATTGALARRVYCAIYTEAERENILQVGPASLYYFTQAVPSNRTFRVSSFGLLNWASVNYTVLFGGSTPDGKGAGSYEDLYVDVAVADGEFVGLSGDPSRPVLTWAASSGQTYNVLSAPMLEPSMWATVLTVQAVSPAVTITGAPAGSVEFLVVEPAAP